MMDRAHNNEKRTGSGEAGTAPVAIVPEPGKPLAEQEATVLLALCIFGEARGESDLARRAVAQVVLNRAQNPRPVFGSRPGVDFAENLRRVILQPQQFSSFNPCDPNYPKLLHPLDHEAPAVWDQCWRCAQLALAAKDEEDTVTANSDHYFDESILPPPWADPAKQTVKIGRLNFYRLYLPSPSGMSPTVSRKGESSAASREARPVAEVPPQPSPAPRPLSGILSYAEPTAPSRLGKPHKGSRLYGSLLSPTHPIVRYLGQPSNRWCDWKGRLSSLKASQALLSTRCSGSLALLLLAVLLSGCSDLERTAYRTLAVTRAEYETLQKHMAEAAVHGLITEEQWNRFQVQGHRFIDAHNATVDAFELWSRTKAKGDSARLEAMLEILPRLIGDLNSLVERLEEKQKQESSSEKSGVKSQKWRQGTVSTVPTSGGWARASAPEVNLPQRLKPRIDNLFSARLKSCPDESYGQVPASFQLLTSEHIPWL